MRFAICFALGVAAPALVAATVNPAIPAMMWGGLLSDGRNLLCLFVVAPMLLGLGSHLECLYGD